VSAAINAGPGGSVDLPSADRADQNSATPIRGRRRAEPAPVAGGSFAAKTLAAAGRAALTILLVLAALVFLFLAVGPRFLNYQTSTMLTGSMSPVINPGDVVVSVRTPVSELEVGDVITYSIPIEDRRIETHRVASIKRDDAGQTSVITKGDANPGADPWTAVLSEDYVYTQAGVVPHLGDVIRALRQPLAQSVLLYGACALLVAVLLTSIWRKPPPDSEVSDSNGVDDAPPGSEGTQGAEPTPSKL
jgi:signal peptidase